MLLEPVVMQHASGLDSTPVVEQHAFELDAAAGVCSRMLSKLVVEQHAFKLRATLEVLSAFDASFRVLSELIVEQHAFGSALVLFLGVDGSVAWVAQHEGNLIFSISAQRHSARSRAIFHCAKELCMSIALVD